VYEALTEVDVPPDSATLRRYMSVAKLASLLSQKALFFVPVWQLEDRFEGVLPSTWQLRHADAVGSAWLAQFRQRYCVSCWHEEDIESDAMWRIYANKEEAVSIRTDVDTLRGQVDSAQERIAIGRVKYIDYDRYSIKTGQEVFYPFMHKRQCFRHEREVRAVILGDLNPTRFGNEPPVTGQCIPVEPRTLIHEVLVSPYSDEWLLRAVSGLVSLAGCDIPVRFSPLR